MSFIWVNFKSKEANDEHKDVDSFLHRSGIGSHEKKFTYTIFLAPKTLMLSQQCLSKIVKYGILPEEDSGIDDN